MKENRLFIGLFPKKAVGFTSLQKRHAETIRPLKTDNMHVTVHFLGNMDDALVEPLKQLLETVVQTIRQRDEDFNSHISSITADSVGGIGRPYHHALVAWLQDGPGDLAALYFELKNGLRRLGCKTEDRRFHPHLTLGYFPKKTGKIRVEKETLKAGLKLGPCCLKLINSELAQGGSVFKELHSIDLF